MKKLINVGSTLPEISGNYFYWAKGETDKNELTYGKFTEQLESENIINSQNNLNYTYDIAHFNCGDTWRIPTKFEFEEILESCKWIWSTIDEKYGYKVIGPNGKSIFFPAELNRYY